MEIIAYVLSGALEHEDSIGNGSVIKPGDVQRMSAGSGVFHSEFNPSASEPVHLIQIWILPGRKNIKPSYEQKHFTEEQRRNGLCLIASPDGSDGSVRINQDARVFASILNEGTSVTHKSAGGRAAWVQVLRGSVSVEGTRLNRGDGAAITDVTEFTVTGNNDAEILLFDLA
jgi:redox-sensitive bicupin YhaK (pirin superfamily)